MITMKIIQVQCKVSMINVLVNKKPNIHKMSQNLVNHEHF